MLQPSFNKYSCRQAQRHLSIQRDHANIPLPNSLQAHLADCESCRRFAQAMNLSIPQPLRSGTSGNLADNALRAWEQETTSATPRLRTSWLYSGMVVAAAGVIVGGVWVVNGPSVSVGNNAVVPVVASGAKNAVVPVTANLDSAPATKPKAGTDSAATDLNRPRPGEQRLQLGLAHRQYTQVSAEPTPVYRRVSKPQPPKRVPPLAGQVDDLAFINQSPTRSLNAWANVTPDDQVHLEQQIRSSLKQGDDFVQVPFPRLVALNDKKAVRDALASFRREASVVDTRLQRTVSLSAKQIPFSEFCEKFTKQTGITFSADSSVADDNIVLFCTDCSLRDVMRQISRHFGFTWRREGMAGNYRYALGQELSAQIAEEELKNRDRAQAILALDRDMQKYRPYLSLTPNQIVEQFKADRETCFAAAKHWAEANDVEKVQLKKEGKDGDSIYKWLDDRQNLWESLGGYRWGAIHLYFLLTPEQRSALRRGETVLFTSLPQTGEYALSPYLEKGIRQSLRAVRYGFSRETAADPNYWSTNFEAGSVGDAALGILPLRMPQDDPKANRYFVTPLTAKPGQIAVSAYLRISQRELGVFDLQAGAGSGKVRNGKTEGYSAINSAAATGISPSVQSPVSQPWAGVAGKVKQGLSGLKLGITTFPATSQNAFLALHIEDDGSLSKANSPEISVADVWERIYQTTRKNILSDGFSRLVNPEDLPSIKGKALPDALNMLCPLLGQRWRAGEGENGKPWVLARSASFFNDRNREVPRRLLEEWGAKRKERGYLSIDEIAEIAQLTGAQLDSRNAREVAVAVYGLREWEMASTPNFRREWHLYNALTEEQRQKIWTSEGLPFKELTEAQQELVFKQQYPSGISSYQRDLYLKGGKFTGKYTTIPEAIQVKRDNQGKPWQYSQDALKPYYEPRIVWIYGYEVKGEGQAATYSYAP